jgi:osmotically-inducible protein OsmY
MNSQRTILTTTLLSLTLCAAPVFAAGDWKGEAKDAWIDGKLESSYLLNSELNNFKTDTLVENGMVTLTGSVPSDAHKALAGEIASNLDGVVKVDNQLTVGRETAHYSDSDRNFSTRFHDMTTTVALKSRFAVNEDIDATDINVDTKDGVVTLEGEVASKTESMLAEEIASSYDYVTDVENHLRIVATR